MEQMKNSATTFVFSSYNFDLESGEAEFHYCIEFADRAPEKYVEILKFPVKTKKVVVDRQTLEPFLQSLHLLLGISFWKMYCPKEIRIEGYAVNESQAKFWNLLYTHGLGEFFYKSQLDFRGLVDFPFEANMDALPVSLIADGPALLPLGGGKDSIVSAHVLKDMKKPFAVHTVNSHPIQEEVIKRLEVEHLVVPRTMDPRMIELSLAKKVYNGHVPATAIYSFVALTSAALFGYSTVVLSNEKSSNYGSVEYLGEQINHQWSKSAEFETMLQQYVRNHLSPQLQIFSILRPYYELEITRRFVEHPEYFPFFSSCNRNFSLTNPQHHGLWCGECPKCAFMFAALAAFLPKDMVTGIFGKNLFVDEGLTELYRQLLGLTEFKPFECVGTPEEMKVAMHLIGERHEFDADPIMKMFLEEVAPTLGDISSLEEKMFLIHEADMIPEEFR